MVVFDRVSPDASLSRTDPGGATHPLDRRDIAADPSTRMPRGDQVAFVSEQTAASWGAAPVRYGTLFVAPDGLTETQARTVRAATDHDPDEWLRRYLTDPEAAAGGVSAEIGGEYADSPPSDGALLGWAAAGASLVFTLLVVAVALALDASESADERALLAAIGAPPSVRRSIVAWQAFLLPALGALVAVPAGMLVAWAVVSPERELDAAAREVGVEIPWAAAALLLLAVPLATAAITWAGAALRGRRRHDLSSLSLAAD